MVDVRVGVTHNVTVDEQQRARGSDGLADADVVAVVVLVGGTVMPFVAGVNGGAALGELEQSM